MIDYSYWFMFFVGIIIATLAMGTGIGGATFFSPIFLTIFKLDLKSAITAGLIIEFFGFLSGFIGYFRKKLINFLIIKQVILFSIIGTFIGTLLINYISEIIVKLILSSVLIYISIQFFIGEKKCDYCPSDFKENKANSQFIKIDIKGKFIHFFGALLFGLSSTGIGELNEYNFLKRLKLDLAQSSATSVFIVSVSALIASFFHILSLDFSQFSQIFSIVIFTIPGVIVGAQLGVYLSSKINKNLVQNLVGILFIILVILIFLN